MAMNDDAEKGMQKILADQSKFISYLNGIQELKKRGEDPFCYSCPESEGKKIWKDEFTMEYIPAWKVDLEKKKNGKRL